MGFEPYSNIFLFTILSGEELDGARAYSRGFRPGGTSGSGEQGLNTFRNSSGASTTFCLAEPNE